MSPYGNETIETFWQTVQRTSLLRAQMDKQTEDVRTKGDCGMRGDTNPTQPTTQEACEDYEYWFEDWYDADAEWLAILMETPTDD